MRSDIEIAHAVQISKITEIAQKIGVAPDDLEQYGTYKAKIRYEVLAEDTPLSGKLILVTAITPTAAGEGKTTTTVGLADALTRIGKRTIVALREPSLGPVFGVKGGAAGGGYAQVVPMEDINLHFTGDFHAVSLANNLLSAMIDNHIQQGNALDIDERKITWRRVIDMNDRQLRNIVCGLGGPAHGIPREESFDITVASELMAILCLASSYADLKERCARIIIGYSHSGRPVTAADLKAQGAMTALLRDALKPNLVQTLEGTPALVHGGPFANIAHGCNSLMATKLALRRAEYVVTEAGFGADLGAEKFIDIKCRLSGLKPDAVVVVATVRALKHHGGAAKRANGGAAMRANGSNAVKANGRNAGTSPAMGVSGTDGCELLKRGLPNLIQHVENILQVFKLPVVVAINRFTSDTAEELSCIEESCRELGVNVVVSDVWDQGSEGGVALAHEVVRLAEQACDFSFTYEDNLSIEEKIESIATKIYHADVVEFSKIATQQAKVLTNLGFGAYPICMAKTQYSFSDNPALFGAPRGFRINIHDLKVSAGAGFIIALAGDIVTLPGLPKVPSAEKIDVDERGIISGLF